MPNVPAMTIDYVATLPEQSELFHAAAAWPDALRQPVPACPGWTVANLVEGGRPAWLRDRPAPEPDATVSATAEQVDLLLWRRMEADRGHVRGDPELFFSFAGWADLD